MTAPSVGGSAVPGTLASNGTYGGGRYAFHYQEELQAADGTLYRHGIQSAEWNWAAMGSTEWAWWNTQYQRGTAMTFELWADDTRNTALSFTSGWLRRPEHEYIEAGMYRNVKITITHLLPLQT